VADEVSCLNKGEREKTNRKNCDKQESKATRDER